MADAYWVLVDAQGAVQGRVMTRDPSITPRAINDNLTNLAERLVTRFGDPKLEKWDDAARAWVVNTEVANELLAKQVKDQAEARRMILYTANRGKMRVYSRKQEEVSNYSGLGGTLSAVIAAFNLMPLDQRKMKFRYAMRDAAKFSDNIGAAIMRFQAGIDNSEDVVAEIEAIEQKTVANIKAASTLAAKKSAAESVVWPV